MNCSETVKDRTKWARKYLPSIFLLSLPRFLKSWEIIRQGPIEYRIL